MIRQPSVAIVILNWNGRHFLEKFLPSVVATKYDNLSIIVADNGSEDDSVALIRKDFPEIRVLLSNTNDGFARGYNQALERINTDYFILLNSDVQVTENWVEPIIQLMESDSSIAACQPKVLSYESKKFFEYAGASGGWIDTFGYPFARGRIFETCEVDNGQYDDACPVFWATGAAFFVRAEVFRNLGGFDEYFVAHQEEIDLCWRMQRAGYKVFVQPASRVYHVGGGTLAMGSRKKVFLNFRNNLVLMTKNLSFAQLWWRIPVRLFLDIVAAYRELVHADFSSFISIASAHLHYVEWLFTGKRQKKLPKKRLEEMTGTYAGNIAWQYFLKKKKTFSEIVGSKK